MMPLDLGVYERTILTCNLKNQDRERGPDTSESDRDKWRAVVNTVMNVGLCNVSNFLSG